MQIKAPPWIFFFFLLYLSPLLRLHYSPVHAISVLKIFMMDPEAFISSLAACANVDILKNKCIFGSCNKIIALLLCFNEDAPPSTKGLLIATAPCTS